MAPPKNTASLVDLSKTYWWPLDADIFMNDEIQWNLCIQFSDSLLHSRSNQKIKYMVHIAKVNRQTSQDLYATENLFPASQKRWQ